MDTANTLYEHIKNRLPVDIEDIGDNNIIYDDDNVPNHKVWNQSLREDHQGDVGVFQTRKDQEQLLINMLCEVANVQIAIVAVDGNIDQAEQYLRRTLEALRTDRQSTGVYVQDVQLIAITPLGKNSIGNQMVSMDLKIKYAFTS